MRDSRGGLLVLPNSPKNEGPGDPTGKRGRGRGCCEKRHAVCKRACGWVGKFPTDTYDDIETEMYMFELNN